MTKRTVTKTRRRTKKAAIPAVLPRIETPENEHEKSMRLAREQRAAELPALKLTGQGCTVANPYQGVSTVADLIAFMHDAGHNPVDVLMNAVEGHLSELAILQRMVCGEDDARTAGSDQDRMFYFFEHMRARLEAAMILDERIKAANAPKAEAV